jgi:hypothetical protein
MDGGNAPIAENVQRSKHLRWSVNVFYKFIHSFIRSSDDWERSYIALNRYVDIDLNFLKFLTDWIKSVSSKSPF